VAEDSQYTIAMGFELKALMFASVFSRLHHTDEHFERTPVSSTQRQL
jgi:hypothetical protein